MPDTHEILFLQGGATLQFSAVPMNFLGKNKKADYVVTGNFAEGAYKEAKRYGDISLAASTAGDNHRRIPAQRELALDKDAAYFYYCANNTIYGTEWRYVPDTGRSPSSATCPQTSCPCRWTCPNTASSSPGPKRTSPPPG